MGWFNRTPRRTTAVDQHVEQAAVSLSRRGFLRKLSGGVLGTALGLAGASVAHAECTILHNGYLTVVAGRVVNSNAAKYAHAVLEAPVLVGQIQQPHAASLALVETVVCWAKHATEVVNRR